MHGIVMVAIICFDGLKLSQSHSVETTIWAFYTWCIRKLYVLRQVAIFIPSVLLVGQVNYVPCSTDPATPMVSSCIGNGKECCSKVKLINAEFDRTKPRSPVTNKYAGVTLE